MATLRDHQFATKSEDEVDLPGWATDLFGGGLSPALIVGGLVAAYLAYRAAKFAIKLAFLGVAAMLFLGTVPWAGADIEGDAAACAREAVYAELRGWQELTTKRVTVEEISEDAACATDGIGLTAGGAVVRTRSFFDIPVQTWAVDEQGARATTLTQIPTEMPDFVPRPGDG